MYLKAVYLQALVCLDYELDLDIMWYKSGISFHGIDWSYTCTLASVHAQLGCISLCIRILPLVRFSSSCRIWSTLIHIIVVIWTHHLSSSSSCKLVHLPPVSPYLLDVTTVPLCSIDTSYLVPTIYPSIGFLLSVLY